MTKIKVELYRASTLHGVLSEFKIVDSDIVFLIGRVFFTQNLNKKTYVGWNTDTKRQHYNSLEEFKLKNKIDEIEFVKKEKPFKIVFNNGKQ